MPPKRVTEQTGVNDQNSVRENNTGRLDPFSGEVNRYQGDSNDWVITGDNGGSSEVSSEVSSGAASTVTPSPVAATSNPRASMTANNRSDTTQAQGLGTQQQTASTSQQTTPKSDLAAAVTQESPKGGSSEAADAANQAQQDRLITS